jgi:hypothetical protein
MHKTSSFTRVFLLILLATLLQSTPGLSQARHLPAADRIDSLIFHKSYFEARDLYNATQAKLEPVKRLEYGAVIDNVFNRLEASNQKIAELQTRYNDQVPDSIHYQLLELQQANYAKLFQYREAAESIGKLLDRFSPSLTEEQIGDFRNTQNIWAALADSPPQEVIITERTVMIMQRDKANLSNLELRQGETTIGFIFDTGANISTVTETTAERLGMRMTDASIEVNAITGIKVQSKLAVCPEFHLGGITVKNAVFLVFPDSALAIPQIDYQINGIIGFPVIEAMKEVQITRSGEFIVPAERSATTDPNMALDFLTPVIRIGDEHYTFDSGASNTILYRNYYDKHRKAIDKRNKEKTIQYGGAGGNISRLGYEISWCPVVSGKKVEIKNVMVFKDILRERETDFYGNIGQDLIGKFEKMTLNFDEMFIRFE